MGFSYIPMPPNGAVLRATPAGNDVDEFNAGVRAALSEGMTNFIIDLKENARAFTLVIPIALKLQSLLAKRGKRIVIVNFPGPADSSFIEKLQKVGFEVKVITPEQTLATQPVAQSSQESLLAASHETVLPPPAEMTKRLELARVALARHLKQKESLEKEVLFYQERLRHLAKGKNEGATPEQLAELAKLEQELSQLRGKTQALKQELARQESLKKDKEKNLQALTVKFKEETKKRENEHKTKMESLKKELSKAEAEFESKAKIRQAEILRLKKQPGGS